MVYVDEGIYDFDLQRALTEISSERREQALRFKHELGRRQCVLAYLLLKRALREEYGITENPIFSYGGHGKPLLVGHPDIYFNLSHCREAVACAVSREPVGIDVESVRRPLHEPLVRYAMSDQEQQAIFSANDPALEFTRLWTMKEARLKLTGEGLVDRLKNVLEDSGYSCETFVSEGRNYVWSVVATNSQKHATFSL